MVLEILFSSLFDPLQFGAYLKPFFLLKLRVFIYFVLVVNEQKLLNWYYVIGVFC